MLTPRGESKHRLPKLTRILLSLVLSNDFVFMFSGINPYTSYKNVILYYSRTSYKNDILAFICVIHNYM